MSVNENVSDEEVTNHIEPIFNDDTAETSSESSSYETDEYDADLEESLRRSAAEIRRNVAAEAGMDNMELADQQLDHYEICKEMFGKKKIHSSNAWDVHVFDYMSTIPEKNLEFNDMLDVAGTSVQVGSLVYGLNVDDVCDEFKAYAEHLKSLGQRESPEVNIEDESSD